MVTEYLSADKLACIVSDRHRITKQEARQVVDLIFTSIAIGMRDGQSIRIPQFGVFFAIERPPRMVMNPRKGMMVQGAAKVLPHIRWSSVLLRESGNLALRNK